MMTVFVGKRMAVCRGLSKLFHCNSCKWPSIASAKTLVQSRWLAYKENDKQVSKAYSATLNLPQMPFALSVYKNDGRCNEREAFIKQLADFDGLYEWQKFNNKGKDFTIHDGPPYANGSPHAGHALNKIIKDVINRYKIMRGYQVKFVPGWDCHGLPIETKARSTLDDKLSDVEVRKLAHSFSLETLEKQKAEFKEWGVVGDWKNPYVTSSPEFIHNELMVFQQLYDKGLIYQDYMPVYWSPSSRTALAEAELEYNPQHTSQSVYVAVEVYKLPDHIKSTSASQKPVHLLIWTTTPWTLPANKAICFSCNLNYSLIQDEQTDRQFIAATDMLDQISNKFNTTFKQLHSFQGEELKDVIYKHPVYPENMCCPLYPAGHVTSDMGTGLVHTAPAHGHEDFKVALQNNLDRTCMVDELGRYTAAAGDQLRGMEVLTQGNDAVCELLAENVIHKETYTHKYPYDWRTKQPVIIRASRQWFIDTNSLVQPSLESLEQVKVIPAVYKNAFSETISTRPYWCISRQRVWGVPIPVFYTAADNKPIVHKDLTMHIAGLIKQYGGDIWWSADSKNLFPAKLRSKIGLESNTEVVKGTDILDIWFDSGVTWSAVLDGQQADMYIEGIDQIRGWFQSSLLTSVALTGKSPYKNVMMHGFTVDEAGQKMSKSVGNVVAPSQIIYGLKNNTKWPAYGVDVLRWWAANKYSVTNVDIGPAVMKQYNDQMLLLRKRMRFILGNLYDYNPDDELIDYTSLLPQDQYFLHLLFVYGSRITDLYDNNEMSSVLNELQVFATKFSNIYTSLSKDRLYCYPKTSVDRLSAQFVLHHYLEVLTKSFAPILPFFAEDCYHHRHSTQLHKGEVAETSVFRAGWLDIDPNWNKPELAFQLDILYKLVEKVRSALAENKPLEQYDIVLYVNKEDYICTILQSLEGDKNIEEVTSYSLLCEVFQCASIRVVKQCMHEDGPLTILLDELGQCQAEVKQTSKSRCPRCRRYTATNIKEPCEMCHINMADDWSI